MGNEKAIRIQTSVLNAMEKKLLVAIASRMPRQVTSDTLTVIGVLGAVVCFIGFAVPLARRHRALHQLVRR